MAITPDRRPSLSVADDDDLSTAADARKASLNVTTLTRNVMPSLAIFTPFFLPNSQNGDFCSFKSSFDHAKIEAKQKGVWRGNRKTRANLAFVKAADFIKLAFITDNARVSNDLELMNFQRGEDIACNLCNMYLST